MLVPTFVCQLDVTNACFDKVAVTIRIKKGKKQLYGSQLRRTKQGKMELYPIEDEPNVNKRRAAMGLGLLEDYVRGWGLTYTLPKEDGEGEP